MTKQLAKKTSEDAIVARLDQARLLLAEATNYTDAKKLVDVAHAAEVYAKRQSLSQQTIDYAHSLKTDAMALLGEHLAAIPKATGGDAQRTRFQKGTESPPTLEELGIDKKLSADSQLLADAKKKEPETFAEVKAGKKTVKDVRRKRKEQKRESRREENRARVETATPEILEAARFATIVIDPPWDWGDEGDQDQLGRARPQYGTMTLDQLLALPVGERADDDCHLYLWITNRSLPKGFQLIERWGFRYVTCLTWCKPSFGMGNYFRGQTEHVLFGVKGSQPLKRKDVGTCFTAPRGPNGHSSKPLAFYDLVESCSPGPYLEMFSRQESPRSDWTFWGEGNG